MNPEDKNCWDQYLEKIIHRRGGYSWTRFFRTFRQLLYNDSTVAIEMAKYLIHQKQGNTVFHCLTLLGMATKYVSLISSKPLDLFSDNATQDQENQLETATLEAFLLTHSLEIKDVIKRRQNSFTSSRRFILSQLIMSHYFARINLSANILDIGTSIGILPMQLNNAIFYDLYINDLTWQNANTAFLTIPINRIYGLDYQVLPDIQWIASCHASSDYYQTRLCELLVDYQVCQRIHTSFEVDSLNIVDSNALASYMRSRSINAVVCNFVLYQYKTDIRNRILECIFDNITSSGIFLNVEPTSNIEDVGCHVKIYVASERRFYAFAKISNSHFMGELTPGIDYEDYMVKYF